MPTARSATRSPPPVARSSATGGPRRPSTRRRHATSSCSRCCFADRGGRRPRARGHHPAAHRPHPAPPGAAPGDAVARRGRPRQRPRRRRPRRARRGRPALARHLRGAHRDAPAPPPPCPPRTETPMADTTSPAPAALELRAVVKRYGAGLTEVRALTDVSLRIEPGELVAIMGPSGCGKSTMLHLAGALEDPDAGPRARRRARPLDALGHGAGGAAPHGRRLRVPAPQPRAVAHRDGERDAAARAGGGARRARRGSGREMRSCPWASPSSSTASPTTSPAASSSASPWPGPWSAPAS